jgi:hypothetical protein
MEKKSLVLLESGQKSIQRVLEGENEQANTYTCTYLYACAS